MHTGGLAGNFGYEDFTTLDETRIIGDNKSGVENVLNNRVRARFLAKSELSEYSYTSYAKHKVCWTVKSIWGAISDLLRYCGAVVIRSYRFVKGEVIKGVTGSTSSDRIYAFIDRYFDEEEGVIVEEDIGHHLTGCLVWGIDERIGIRKLFVDCGDLSRGVDRKTVFPRKWPQSVRDRLRNDTVNAGISEVNWAFDNGFTGVIEQKFMVRMMRKGLILPFYAREIVKIGFQCRAFPV